MAGRNKFDLNVIKEKINILVNKFRESKKFRIISLLVLVLIVIVIIFCFINGFGPKNSVTVYVTDQYGESIDGLEISISNEDNSYMIKFSNNMSKSRALDVVPGDYSLNFYTIPNSYTCFTVTDTFTLKKNGKVKLEYECFKSE